MRLLRNKRRGRTLGERIRDEREDRDISQQNLAKDIGITPGMMSQIEGDKRDPSLEVFRKIVRKLEVSSDFLLGFSEVKKIKEDER
ncbi:MAG: helix-turn-helix domain-containing protein [Bacillaceae bacterium]|nr:helix-turn-helix domain-containing protein [Bacillaceae bacterium]